MSPSLFPERIALRARPGMPIPRAAPRLTGDQFWQAAEQWCLGRDTLEIARSLGASEASVANTLPAILEATSLLRVSKLKQQEVTRDQ